MQFKWNDAVCVDHYFSDSAAENGEDSSPDDPIYKAVLDSKSTDETLVRIQILLVLSTGYFGWLGYLQIASERVVIWSAVNSSFLLSQISLS